MNESMRVKAPLSDFCWDKLLCPSKLSSTPVRSLEHKVQVADDRSFISLFTSNSLLPSTQEQIVFLNNDVYTQLKQSKIHQVS